MCAETPTTLEVLRDVPGVRCGGVSLIASLIHHSLANFTEQELLALTPDKEPHLLISLSQVLTQIRRFTNQQQSCTCFSSHSYHLQLFTNHLPHLILFLNVKNRYLQHLVVNIFLAISNFLVSYGTNWEDFIHLLCVCFEFSLCNIVGIPIQPSLSGEKNSGSVFLNFNLVKSKLNNSTWSTVAGITAPWDVLNENHNCCSKDTSLDGKDESGLTNTGEVEVKILFLGNLIQLLCSLVGVTSLAETSTGSDYNFAILPETCELVPKLLHWCLAQEWIHRHQSILPYFRHKILMLMIRISFSMQLDCAILVQWLELIHKYYHDLLARPISQLEYGEDAVLEGSPFLLSLCDQEVHPLSSCHLQRQLVFLFLRCSLTLISLRKSTANLKCGCVRSNSYVASELKSIRVCCPERRGMLDFFGWFQNQVSPILFSVDEMYLEKCINFASSFIKLYMHEDDMLFEVLLQMFTVPSSPERPFLEEGNSCPEAEKDILFHISNFFNPILLFHLFLSAVQYDHQLLLDYLISKDSGSKCAEYLLRCLRTVCDSWTMFVRFSANEQVIFQKSCKRRRLLCDNSYEEQSTIPLQSGIDLSTVQQLNEQEMKNKFSKNRCIQFEKAKACLLSLRNALRKLHNRKLFPYNPVVLIKRLSMFEELCKQHV